MAQETLAVWLPKKSQCLHQKHWKRVSHTGSEEESDEWENHLVAEFLAEEEYSQHDPYGYYAQHGHCVLYDLQDLAKLFDVARESIDQVTREDVGPETVLPLPESNL